MKLLKELTEAADRKINESHFDIGDKLIYTPGGIPVEIVDIKNAGSSSEIYLVQDDQGEIHHYTADEMIGGDFEKA